MQYHIIQALKEEKNTTVLATIIETRGSTPRKAGTQMIVCRDGRLIGTIGGGCAEAEIRLEALQVMDEGIDRVREIGLYDSVAAVEGMVCGGFMKVLLQCIE